MAQWDDPLQGRGRNVPDWLGDLSGKGKGPGPGYDPSGILDPKKRAKIENILDELEGRAPPMVVDPAAERRRAKLENDLDTLLNRPPPDVTPAPGTAKKQSTVAQDISQTADFARRHGAGSISEEADKTLKIGSLAARSATGDVGAMVELGVEAVKEGERRRKLAIEGASQFASEVASPLHKQRLGEIAGGVTGGAMEGMGKALQSQPGGEMVGKVIEEQGRFVKGLFEATDKLRDWSRTLHENDLQFKEYSGKMAAVGARQEVRDIMLSQERGERRGQAAEFLAREKHGLEKTAAPWEDLAAKMQDIVAGTLDRGLTTLLGRVAPLADRWNIALDKYMGEQGADPFATQQLQDMAELSGQFDRNGRPKRFP